MERYSSDSIRGAWLATVFLVVAMLCTGCAQQRRPYIRPANGIGVNDSTGADSTGAHVAERLLLIGDAGLPDPSGEPVLDALRVRAGEIPERTTVIFLGDNVYEQGMPAADSSRRAVAERRLDAQIDICIDSGARGLFLPGNHDWAEEGSDGWNCVKRQSDHIAARDIGAGDGGGSVEMIPAHGDPMPVAIDLDPVRLILIDTQWFLHTGPKPDVPVSEVLSELTSLIHEARDDQLVVVCGHHPLTTHGPHSGEFSLAEYAFAPEVLARWAGISRQDLMHPAYRELAEQLTEAMSGARRPIVYASGHEHNLQIIELEHGPIHQLVSGAGSDGKLHSVGHGDDTIFSWSHTGFMEIDFLADGRAVLRVLAPDEAGQPEIVFSMWLPSVALTSARDGVGYYSPAESRR